MGEGRGGKVVNSGWVGEKGIYLSNLSFFIIIHFIACVTF